MYIYIIYLDNIKELFVWRLFRYEYFVLCFLKIEFIFVNKMDNLKKDVENDRFIE